MVSAYLKYLKNRVNAHGIHSPFVFEFYNEIIKKGKEQQNTKVERLRKTLLSDESLIGITDFGAGSRKNKSNNRTVKEMAKNAAIQPKFGGLLIQLIQHYKLKSALELGTSLGIGTAYLGLSKEDFKVTSIEGCPNTADLARRNMLELGLNKVDIQTGEFSTILKEIDKTNVVYDLIYIDGNHKLGPTLNYFAFALNHLSDNGFIIFDDIHWSTEMEQAWEEIKVSDQVNVTMDLFQIGVVCKRKGQRKENFILKY